MKYSASLFLRSSKVVLLKNLKKQKLLSPLFLQSAQQWVAGYILKKSIPTLYSVTL